MTLLFTFWFTHNSYNIKAVSKHAWSKNQVSPHTPHFAQLHITNLVEPPLAQAIYVLHIYFLKSTLAYWTFSTCPAHSSNEPQKRGTCPAQPYTPSKSQLVRAESNSSRVSSVQLSRRIVEQPMQLRLLTIPGERIASSSAHFLTFSTLMKCSCVCGSCVWV